MATLTSSPSASSSVTTTTTDWWLKDPYDESYNMILDVTSDPLRISKQRDQAAFNAIGRKFPVVVKEQVFRAARILLQVDTITEAGFVNIETMRDSGHTLLLQSPLEGRQWYVEFDSNFDEDLDNTVTPYRNIHMPFVEVDNPGIT